MKRVAKLLLTVGIVLISVSCFDPVEFPDAPGIEFESLVYKDTDALDSLILSFRFEDGDAKSWVDRFDKRLFTTLSDFLTLSLIITII